MSNHEEEWEDLSLPAKVESPEALRNMYFDGARPQSLDDDDSEVDS